MSIAERVYNKCPVSIQNILISAYGYKLKKQRYKKKFHSHFESLIKSQFLPQNQIQKLQHKKMTDILHQAINNVPYYQKLLQKKSLDVTDITPENYQKILPVITKENLRNNQDDFINTKNKKSETVTIGTSGTSGTPLTITTTTDNLQNNYAFFYRYLTWAGIHFGDRCATFAGRSFIPPNQSQPPYWRYNYSTNAMLCSSYHISESTALMYIEALENFNPAYIDTYPSAISEIANYINEYNISHKIKLKAIITSSETLFDYQRKSIEKAFRCKVFDHLGSAEMVTLITQCENGTYHINPEFGLVEVLDANDQPVPIGSPGRLICTSLINIAMPLIRYELGDSITLSDDTCQCGRNFPVVSSIIGRTDDMIIGCDGKKIGRLDPIFKKMKSGVKETQIIQTDTKNIIIKMVTDCNYDRKDTDDIITELKNRVGDCVQYHIEYVDHIPRTQAGKFRSVISMLEKVNDKIQ